MPQADAQIEDDVAPHKKRDDTLWVTDAEMIRRLGVPEKVAREAIRLLDHNPTKSRFPQKNKLWGNRRYWPAVKAYFDQGNQLQFGAAPTRRAS